MRKFTGTSKRAVNNLVTRLGFQFVMTKRLDSLAQQSTYASRVSAILNSDEITDYAKVFLSSNIQESHAQVFQDLVALMINEIPNESFFVEFGAAGGKVGSNTYLLEQVYGWNGIVAEPAKIYSRELHLNRKCKIDTRCVYSHSDLDIEFLESKTTMLSTIVGFEERDSLALDRKTRRKYHVKTVSLNDLLLEHGAPEEISYISIDTEGSELEILKCFDFTKHTFRFISVEHNTQHHEQEIENLLQANGYRRVLSSLSRFDSWYVHSNFDTGKYILSK